MEKVIEALKALEAAAASGKMTEEDFFEIGMLAAKHRAPEDQEKKTA